MPLTIIYRGFDVWERKISSICSGKTAVGESKSGTLNPRIENSFAIVIGNLNDLKGGWVYYNMTTPVT